MKLNYSAETMYTIIVAHPDDEIIFCWPVLKQSKEIIACVSDRTGQFMECFRDGRRITALVEIGNLLGVPTRCLDLNSFFSKESSLGSKTVSAAAKAARQIFTHNAWGEYDHPDHKLVHKLVQENSRIFYTTDIDMRQNRKPAGEKVAEAVIDRDFFDQCKAVYDKHGAWTWSRKPIEKTAIYKQEGWAGNG